MNPALSESDLDVVTTHATPIDWEKMRARREREDRAPPATPAQTPRPSADPPHRPALMADLVKLEDVEESEVRWLWPGRIPMGKLTVLAGDPGLGKSFVTLDIAARLSTGTPWADDLDTPQTPRAVVLLSAEDDVGDTILPRLRAARADISRISVLRGMRSVYQRGPDGTPAPVPFSLDRDVAELDRVIETLGDVGLVVIDPISAYAGRTDTNSNSEVRALLAPLAELAMRRGIAVLLVTHLNKGSGTKGIYRISGSLALPAAARSAMLVVRDQDNPARRLMLVTKMNVGAMAAGMAYSIGDEPGNGSPVVQWESEPVRLTADEAVRAEEAAPEGASVIQEAIEFLRQLLADGPVTAAAAIEQAGTLGLNESVLQRARARLGIKSRRTPNGWAWAMPVAAGSPNTT